VEIFGQFNDNAIEDTDAVFDDSDDTEYEAVDEFGYCNDSADIAIDDVELNPITLPVNDPVTFPINSPVNDPLKLPVEILTIKSDTDPLYVVRELL
jgi:hypothetical protein